MKAAFRFALAFAAALALVPGLAGAQAAKFVVGYANQADSDFFTNSRRTAFVEAARADPRLHTVFADANGDIARQLDQIDNFIARKVGTIIVAPVDYQGIVPAVEKANRAGIPVIALGIASAGGKTTFVGSRNSEAGRLQGEFMAKTLPQGARIVYLQGQPGLYHSKERMDGFMNAMAARTDVTVLASLPAHYDRAEGMKVTEDWIQRFAQFDALIAANDQMALGALQALKAAGRKGVMISGIDGVQEALAAIRAGEMAQTVFQDARSQAMAAYQAVKRAMDGQALPAEILIPFASIHRDNVDTYLK